MISTVLLYFKALEPFVSKQAEEPQKKYSTVNDLLRQAATEIRRITHDLGNSILIEFGLKKQVEAMARTITDSGQLEVHVNTYGFKERLDSLTEARVYRIIQELANNTIKHAQARTLLIQLNRFKAVLNILVEDDGKGFDPNQKSSGAGMGLNSIRALLRDLNGILNIDSQLQRGTTISIDIPIPEIFHLNSAQ